MVKCITESIVRKECSTSVMQLTHKGEIVTVAYTCYPSMPEAEAILSQKQNETKQNPTPVKIQIATCVFCLRVSAAMR